MAALVLPSFDALSSRVDDETSFLGPVDEDSLCRNYYCCGEALVDLHELLQHIEDCHANDDDGYSSPSGDFLDLDHLALDSHILESDTSSPSSPCDSPSHDPFWSRETDISPSQVVPHLRTLMRNNNRTFSPQSPMRNQTALAKTTSLGSYRPKPSTACVPAHAAGLASSGMTTFKANSSNTSSGPRRTQNGAVKRPLNSSSASSSSQAMKRSRSADSLVPTTSRPASPNTLEGSDSEVSPQSGRTSPSKQLISSSANSNSSASAASAASSTVGADNEFKPYRCPYHSCGKSYKNANGLKYHMNHGHTGDANGGKSVEKPYVCPIPGCDKKYKNPNGLKYHIAHSHQAVAEQALAALGAAFLNATNGDGSGFAPSAASSPSMLLSASPSMDSSLVAPLSPSSAAAAAAAALATASMLDMEDQE